MLKALNLITIKANLPRKQSLQVQSRIPFNQLSLSRPTCDNNYIFNTNYLLDSTKRCRCSSLSARTLGLAQKRDITSSRF